MQNNVEEQDTLPDKKELKAAVKQRRRDAKARAKKALKKNYIACIAVCFIMVFIAGEYSSTTSAISSYDNSNVADLKFTPEQKQEIVEDMIKSGDTAEEISDEWGVENPDAVTKWVQAYKEFGVDGLNSKEVTFFGSTSDTSNWQTVMDTFDVVQTAKEKADFFVSDKTSRFATAATSYFDGLTKNHSYQFQFVSSILGFLSKQSTWDNLVAIGNFLFSLFMTIFVTNILLVCERRFFLENRTYKKTKIGRLGFLFRERTLHPAKTMIVKDIYKFFWSLTLVGWVIKSYSYAMVPFILAENPNIKSNKCITLSRRMMKGHKWELFKVDLSLLGWTILSSMTLGLLSILFVNPYKTAIHAEMYIKFRRMAIENGIEFSGELNDKYLDLDLLQKQMEDEAAANGENPDVANYKAAFTICVPESEKDSADFGKGEVQ